MKVFLVMLSLFLKTYNLIPDFVYESYFSDTVYITCVNETVAKYAIQLADIIRSEDFPCIIDYKFKNLKSQLSRASELGILIALIVGEKEMEQNKVSIKNMATNTQKTIKSEEIIEEIYKILDEFEEKNEIEDN